MGFLKRLLGSNKKPTEQVSKQFENIPSENESDGSRGNAILEFHRSIQTGINWNELNDVEFGMWLPNEKDPRFSESSIVEKWDVIYSITKDYWSYIAADILKILDEIDEETFRIGLPEDFQAFAFLTTEGEQIVFSISQEKGIRFHFSETTSLEYRSDFMDHFIAYCNAWKSLVKQNNGEQDEDLEFDKWWKYTLEVSKGVEEKEPLNGVGKIVK
ncbi:hypothetical protein [Fluviicola taffensis]|uniref:hypothetical protein n=1 Tax=Fluviicola taffensis TaxID=191579 RepID=UPI0031384012